MRYGDQKKKKKVTLIFNMDKKEVFRELHIQGAAD